MKLILFLFLLLPSIGFAHHLPPAETQATRAWVSTRLLEYKNLDIYQTGYSNQTEWAGRKGFFRVRFNRFFHPERTVTRTQAERIAFRAKKDRKAYFLPVQISEFNNRAIAQTAFNRLLHK